MKKSGFTLVELMVVVVIIGILAALAIPRFLSASNRSKAAEFKPILKQLHTLQLAYLQEHDRYGLLVEVGFDDPGKSARFDYEEPVKGVHPVKGILSSSLGVAKVKAGILIRTPDATGKDELLVSGADDVCVNDQGIILAQSNLIGSLAAVNTSSNFLICAP